MERTHLFDAALAQKLVDSIAAELNQNVNITDHKGLIIASFDKKRIGTTHEITAKKLAAGEYREFSISEEEALIYPGVRRGVNVPIIYDHVCYGVVGVTGEPSQASPYARLATKFVTAMLSSLTHKEQWLQVLKEKQRMRSLLLNQLIEVQEEERKRIARELHDETSQALTAALLNLRALAGSLDEPNLQQKALDVREIVSEALESIQYMTISLRPLLLDQLGLLPALRKHIENYKKRYLIEVDFHVSGITSGTRFFPEIEISIYRIIQEAMNNIMKHAQATRLSISLSHTGRLLQLQVKDNGSGFHLSILKQHQLQHNSLGIIGMKEATGNIERAQWLIRDVPKGFAVYSGDDPTAVALMLCGGQGNISVTANVAPRLMHELCVAAVAGQRDRAMAIQLQLLPLHRHLFVEANPIPVKWAMARLGLCGGTLRLPMTPLDKAHEPVVEQALQSAGLL